MGVRGGQPRLQGQEAVSLGFWTTARSRGRHSACREEVRVNRELAPGLYLGVGAIVRSRTGTGFCLAPGDAPNAIEYAVEMLSFNEQDTFAGLIATGSIIRAHVAAVAHLTDFHRSVAIVDDWGPDRVLAVARQSGGAARDGPSARVARGWRRLLRRGIHPEARAGTAAPRVAGARPRRTRGPACEHVLVAPAIRVVDRIEFDPRLGRIYMRHVSGARMRAPA